MHVSRKRLSLLLLVLSATSFVFAEMTWQCVDIMECRFCALFEGDQKVGEYISCDHEEPSEDQEPTTGNPEPQNP